MGMLKITNLSKKFEVTDGKTIAVRNLDLEVEKGKFFVLLGPSGCGKSTLLRCVAGLEGIEEGEISLDGRLVSSAERCFSVDPEDRGIAMVFQTYAIWPHMTVFDNVAFPLTEAKNANLSRAKVQAKVKDILALVRLADYGAYSAATMSGGQQQRIALARALVREPKLLLMDEPLSNLDAKLREEMRDEIKQLTRALGVTTLHVTHDQTEAMALADSLAVMSAGKILQLGEPEHLYRRPVNRMVAEFLGRTNWLTGKVDGTNHAQTEMGGVSVILPASTALGSDIRLGIRPEWAELTRDPHGGLDEYRGIVTGRSFLGDIVVYKVKVGGVELLIKSNAPDIPAYGEVTVLVPPDRWVVFSGLGAE